MPHLTDPLAIGGLTLSNRLVMPPMATRHANEDGSISDALLGYYAEKSSGGPMGLVIIEHSYVAPEGRVRNAQPSAATDDMVPGLKRLSETIHGNGPRCVVQLNHAGAAAPAGVIGMAPVAPSAVRNPATPDADLPRALTPEDIAVVVAAFAGAARRTREAGFDGVEIHSAHGYLLDQFYSPLTNRRTDEYGGTLSNRIRIHLEVIAAVRAAVGEDFPVFLRLGACDYLEGGSTVDDAVQACIAFENAGVDVIDITGGLTGYARPAGKPEQGYFSDVTEAIKKAVSVPVLLTGGIVDIEVGERLVAEGRADLIGVGRPMMRDSNWAAAAIAKLRRSV